MNQQLNCLRLPIHVLVFVKAIKKAIALVACAVERSASDGMI